MLRLLLGLGVVTLVAVSCAGEDGKRKVRDGEAGAGGEAGSPGPSGGGSESDPTGAGAGAGGEPGIGGVAGVGGGSQAGAGAAAGGTPNASAGEGSGGTNSEPGAGAAGQANLAGAAGATSATGSQFCGQPNEYYVGEGVCAPCEGEPSLVQQTCVEAFAAKSLLSDGEPIAILLTPVDYPREPLPVSVDVAYVNPNLTLSHELKLDFATSRYDITIQSGPDNPGEVLVRPFKIQGVCGDTFELIDGVRFLHSGGDNYVVTCPDQT